MNMQQSTAKHLVVELTSKLEEAIGDEDIILSDLACALIKDTLARNDLIDAINDISS